LANASLGSSASVAPSSANDPNAPASAASSTTGGVTFKLDGKERDLKQHMNQRVEIIGRLDSPSRDAKDNSTFAGEQEINVDSVRMIAASCS